MIGKKLGSLTVVSQISAKKWHCVCDCGKSRDFYESEITGHNPKSCGCSRINDNSRGNSSHGLSKSPVYKSWIRMKRRCFSPSDISYEHYKSRGISAHPDFRESFEAFYAEIGDKPSGKGWSVGRIDNNGWYTYGNIRWETTKQQARNKTKLKNNKSGTTGVSLSTKNSEYGYEFWEASWRDESGKKTKSFSCNKYGHDKAKQMAIDYRNKMIEELNNRGFEYAESHGSS